MAVRISIEEVLGKLPDSKLVGEYYRHKGSEQSDWTNPSLIFREVRPGWTYFYDFSQPDWTEFDICKKLGFDVHPGLFDKEDIGPPDKMFVYLPMEDPVPVTCKWLYPKRFEQWHIKDGRYIPNMQGVERRLYNLPGLSAAEPKEVVFLVEGEKDVDNLVKIDVVATTFQGGAQHHEKTKNIDAFKNRKVAIYPDNDNVGLIHAWEVAKRLEGTAKEIKILVNLLPNKKHSDITDWLASDTGMKTDALKSFLLHLYEAAEKLNPTRMEEMYRGLGIKSQSEGCILSHSNPSKSAEIFEKQKFTDKTETGTDIITYRNYCESPIIFTRQHGSWEFQTKGYVNSIIQKFTEEAKQAVLSKKNADVKALAAGFDGMDYVAFMPKKADIDEIFSALQNRNYFRLPENIGLPFWLTGETASNPRPASRNIIVTLHGILDITDMDHIKLRSPPPELLNFATLNVDIDPADPPPYPTDWFSWLRDWFQDDDAIRHSAKWSALLSRPDTSHKLELYLQGQSNSGKTTWLYYIMQMLGRKNVLSSSIQQLGDDYGLADAPGKLAIIIDDAQYGSARNLGLFLQRRRNISGETPVVIRRMRENPFDTLLSARLIYASDDLPRSTDSGGQDEVRRSVLRFLFDPRRSKEKKLNMKEHKEMINKMLPSIWWHYTLQLGERALREDKGLTNPANTQDIVEEIRWDTQPYIKFLESEFTEGVAEAADCKALVTDSFERWQMFCRVNDIDLKSRENKKLFSQEFTKNTGIRKMRISSIWYFVGVKLKLVNKAPTADQDASSPEGDM